MAKDLHSHDRNTYWSRNGETGFKIPDIHNPYVFLDSLFLQVGASRRVGELAERRLKTYSEFHANNNVNNGLDFLQEIIVLSKQHELNFINNKIKKLQALGELGEEEKKILDELDKINSGEFNYKSFIELFNTVITGIQKYKARLQGFTDRKVINTPQLNLVQGLGTLVSTFTDQRTEVYLSQEELIRQLTIEFFKRDAGRNFIQSQIIQNGIDNIIAAMAIVSQQLAQFIYDNPPRGNAKKLVYERQKVKNKDIALLSAEDFKQQFEEICSRFDEFEQQNNVEKIYKDDPLLQEIKKMYGITIAGKQSARRSNNKMKKINDIIHRDAKNIFNDKNINWPSVKTILKRIDIKFKGNKGRELSLVNELVSSFSKGIDSHVHLGNLNTGTDVLLGVLEVNVKDGNPPQQTDPISGTLRKIKQQLVRSTEEDYLRKNAEVYEKELNDLDKVLKEIGHGFILHETTKSYNNLERGKWPGKMNSFTGREMQLTNYISAIGMMDIENLNIDELQFIALNLATDALGNDQLDPLKKYLSIFGGLIMFDDFTLIAKEFTKKQQFSNIDNIHLYHLQGTYFPASVFLEATYNSMKNLQNDLLSGNEFTTSIEVPTINYYANLETYGETFEKRWEQVKLTAEKETEITLHFGHNFLHLMTQLFQ